VYNHLEKDFNGKLIITLEQLGSLTKINDEFKLVPSVKVESVDSTGAGDIYHGAFTHFMAHGYNLLDTMKYANIAGALSVKKIGSKNSMPNLEDVINYHEL
jgi:sugar/nucleoside kinase (ribokinase family)